MQHRLHRRTQRRHSRLPRLAAHDFRSLKEIRQRGVAAERQFHARLVGQVAVGLDHRGLAAAGRSGQQHEGPQVRIGFDLRNPLQDAGHRGRNADEDFIPRRRQPRRIRRLVTEPAQFRANLRRHRPKPIRPQVPPRKPLTQNLNVRAPQNDVFAKHGAAIVRQPRRSGGTALGRFIRAKQGSQEALHHQIRPPRTARILGARRTSPAYGPGPLHFGTRQTPGSGQVDQLPSPEVSHHLLPLPLGEGWGEGSLRLTTQSDPLPNAATARSRECDTLKLMPDPAGSSPHERRSVDNHGHGRGLVRWTWLAWP